MRIPSLTPATHKAKANEFDGVVRVEGFKEYPFFDPRDPHSRRLVVSALRAPRPRACYQRNKARDIYDLGMFATRPLDHPLVRRLVVLKLWQARDSFDPERR